jgi:hypothetical protein
MSCAADEPVTNECNGFGGGSGVRAWDQLALRRLERLDRAQLLAQDAQRRRCWPRRRLEAEARGLGGAAKAEDGGRLAVAQRPQLDPVAAGAQVEVYGSSVALEQRLEMKRRAGGRAATHVWKRGLRQVREHGCEAICRIAHRSERGRCG